MYTMQFYTYNDADGNVHVQNAVAGMLGQHHVHTPEDFKRWCRPNTEITEMGGLCDCGMKPGEMCDGWPKAKVAQG